jgi:hypothetical protein
LVLKAVRNTPKVTRSPTLKASGESVGSDSDQSVPAEDDRIDVTVVVGGAQILVAPSSVCPRTNGNIDNETELAFSRSISEKTDARTSLPIPRKAIQ